RSLLKKQHGCGLIPGKVPTGRAFRRKLLLTTIRRMSDSPNEAAQGTCFEGLLHLFDRNSSKEGCDLDFSCSLDGPKISTTHSDSAARPARPSASPALGLRKGADPKPWDMRAEGSPRKMGLPRVRGRFAFQLNPLIWQFDTTYMDVVYGSK
ncbi:unnamed protein product, partial [Effrenium voratum]